MQDRIEQWIAEHKAEMDVYEPRADLWAGVEQGLKQKRNAIRLRWMAGAAAALLVVCAMLLVLRPLRKEVYVDKQGSQLNSQLRDAEVYYTSVVAMKRSELQQYCSTEPTLCNEFEQEIDTLHYYYKQLQTEYQHSPRKELVLQAMFDNLQKQVAIISRQLNIAKQVKQEQQQPTIKTM